MKKYIFSLCALLVLMCSLSGCTRKTEYRFMQDTTQICAIEIVKTGVLDLETGYIPFTTICAITDVQSFLEEFGLLECWIPCASNPTKAPDNCTMFRFVYQDGGYELVHYGGQSQFFADGSGFLWNSVIKINKESYEGLIENYLPKENTGSTVV